MYVYVIPALFRCLYLYWIGSSFEFPMLQAVMRQGYRHQLNIDITCALFHTIYLHGLNTITFV